MVSGSLLELKLRYFVRSPDFSVQGIISGRFADRGYVRSQVLIGSVVFVATQFLIAEATEYWQLMLGQGIALGVSAAASI